MNLTGVVKSTLFTRIDVNRRVYDESFSITNYYHDYYSRITDTFTRAVIAAPTSEAAQPRSTRAVHTTRGRGVVVPRSGTRLTIHPRARQEYSLQP